MSKLDASEAGVDPKVLSVSQLMDGGGGGTASRSRTEATPRGDRLPSARDSRSMFFSRRGSHPGGGAPSARHPPEPHAAAFGSLPPARRRLPRPARAPSRPASHDKKNGPRAFLR